eukprot:m.259178 g.259178  ORF g.259178 m.259178 type:complete len:58 (+) comp40415_c1_seq37:2011-2184(+)
MPLATLVTICTPEISQCLSLVCCPVQGQISTKIAMNEVEEDHPLQLEGFIFIIGLSM